MHRARGAVLVVLAAASLVSSSCGRPAEPAIVDVGEAPSTSAMASPSAAVSAESRGCSVLGLAKRLGDDDLEEARSTIGAIERGAISAFEREQPTPASNAPTHALCKTAEPFPRTVPRCGEHALAPAATFDDDHDGAGWYCLKFAITEPVSWQYGYIQGGPYKGIDRGAKDPGPRGFQVWAERDADGDGKTALFVGTGAIDGSGDMVRLDTEIQEIDPRE
jgi:type IV pilus assembly protein PilA